MGVALISDFLLVRELVDAPTTERIVSPYGRHAEEPKLAVVLAAGPGLRRDTGLDPMPCDVGDTVMLQFNAGTVVRIDGEELRIVLARDIFGVVRP